jgi:hypothetical protein
MTAASHRSLTSMDAHVSGLIFNRMLRNAVIAQKVPHLMQRNALGDNHALDMEDNLSHRRTVYSHGQFLLFSFLLSIGASATSPVCFIILVSRSMGSMSSKRLRRMSEKSHEASIVNYTWI